MNFEKATPFQSNSPLQYLLYIKLSINKNKFLYLLPDEVRVDQTGGNIWGIHCDICFGTFFTSTVNAFTTLHENTW